jgi:DNA primase
MVEKALSIFDFYFEDAFSRFDKNEPAGRKKISNYLLPIIKRIENRIEQYSWVQKLANRLGVKEEVVEKELENVKMKDGLNDEEDKEDKKEIKKTRQEALEERLLVLLLKEPSQKSLIDDQVEDLLLPRTKKVLENLNKKEISEEVQDFYSYLALKADLEEMKKEDLVSDIKFCLNEIKDIYFKEKLQEVSTQLKKAEANKDKEEVKRLLKKCRQLTKNNKNDS